MKAESCREWRELLGAYALEQLPEEERPALEAHLDGCPECRTELASLRSVASLLPLADPSRFSSAPAPPASLGERIATQLRREQRAKRRQRFGGFALGGAVAAALAAAVLAIFVLGGNGGGNPEQQVKFTALPTGVTIDATLEPHSYGTEVHMYVHGLPSGTLCRVSLRGPHGVSYPAGTFRYRWGEDSEAVMASALDLSRTRAVVVEAGNRTFIAPVGRAPIAAIIQNEEEST